MAALCEKLTFGVFLGVTTRGGHVGGVFLEVSWRQGQS